MLSWACQPLSRSGSPSLQETAAIAVSRGMPPTYGRLCNHYMGGPQAGEARGAASVLESFESQKRCPARGRVSTDYECRGQLRPILGSHLLRSFFAFRPRSVRLQPNTCSYLAIHERQPGLTPGTDNPDATELKLIRRVPSFVLFLACKRVFKQL